MQKGVCFQAVFTDLREAVTLSTALFLKLEVYPPVLMNLTGLFAKRVAEVVDLMRLHLKDWMK